MLGETSNLLAEIALPFTAIGATFAPLLKRLSSNPDNEELRTSWILVFGIFLLISTMGVWFAANSVPGRLLTGALATVTLAFTIPQARLAWRQRKGRKLSFYIYGAVIFGSITALAHVIGTVNWAQWATIVCSCITCVLAAKWLHLQLFTKARREFVE